MPKKLLGAAVLFCFVVLNGTVYAADGTFSTTANSITLCCTSYQDNTYSVIHYPSTCDDNEKTPSEVIDCKIAYWRKQAEDLSKEMDELQKRLDHAKERQKAFEKVRGDR